MAGGHTTEVPSFINYSSAVSRDSDWLAFTIVALKGVDVISCDFENAYLNAMCRKKIWFEGGTECGENKGKVLIIVRAVWSQISGVVFVRITCTGIEGP